jgi:alpha-L-fucosidase 2
MIMKHIALIFIIYLFFAGCKPSENKIHNNERLWYTYPAQYWNSQGLHLGNGYFGATFFGGIEQETFALSDPSMWTGEPAMGRWEQAGVNPRAKGSLQKIRDATFNRQTHLADSLISENFFGSMELYGHFTSIGDLNIKFPDHTGKHEKYVRELDLANSLGKIQYVLSDILFTREYFCSYPDRVMGMKFSANKPGNISMDISVDILQDSSIITISENLFHVKGFINGNSRPFVVLLRVNNVGGDIDHEVDVMKVRNADSVEIFLTIGTNYALKYPDYKGEDPDFLTRSVLEKVVSSDYEQLKKKHISDYKSLYDRISIEIEGNPEVEVLPTNERYENLKGGGSDAGYKVLAFNLGRYMIISSSRPKTLPSNLQGVWNTFNVAPWAGNYQSNINIQEIYWSCGPLDLAECQEPYIDWIEDLTHSGREMARRIYGTNGWISHTVGNIWGHAAPVGNHPWGMYSQGSTWHCQHVWEQYAFTQDKEYLKDQAYPILKEASVFWLENLLPFEGYLATAPTVSAEHGALFTDEGLNPAFHDFRSDKYLYSLPGVYQDIQMIWDLFTNTAKAAQIIGEPDFSDSLLSIREKLLPLKTGKHGQLQEWYDDIDDPDCHHRHIAHLYAVCPGTQIHPTTTPELAEAAKTSLNMRGDGRFIDQELASGGNWARAHRMWCWTRLMDGNRANKIMTEMLTEEGFENVLTFQHANYHWERKDLFMEGDLYLHFQLDGSAALPGCIAEMLVQSHLGEIHLLPALPDEFHTGEIKGLKARGGYSLDLVWKAGELLYAEISCPPGSTIPDIRLKNDRILPGENKNIKITRL